MEYNISIEISDSTEICSRIDSIRQQKQLNQEQLAAHLNISQPAVSKYLKERVPPADILLKLARMGQTTIEWILTGKKSHFYMADTATIQEKENVYGSDADIQLARSIAQLPPQARQTIKSLLELLKNTDQK